MSSENKKKKLKNSYGCKSTLKHKGGKLKKFLFFTSSQRQENNTVLRSNG